MFWLYSRTMSDILQVLSLDTVTIFEQSVLNSEPAIKKFSVTFMKYIIQIKGTKRYLKISFIYFILNDILHIQQIIPRNPSIHTQHRRFVVAQNKHRVEGVERTVRLEGRFERAHNRLLVFCGTIQKLYQLRKYGTICKL